MIEILLSDGGPLIVGFVNLLCWYLCKFMLTVIMLIVTENRPVKNKFRVCW